MWRSSSRSSMDHPGMSPVSQQPPCAPSRMARRRCASTLLWRAILFFLLCSHQRMVWIRPSVCPHSGHSNGNGASLAVWRLSSRLHSGSRARFAARLYGDTSIYACARLCVMNSLWSAWRNAFSCADVHPSRTFLGMFFRQNGEFDLVAVTRVRHGEGVAAG